MKSVEMRRRWLQWRIVAITDRITKQRLKLRLLSALKFEAELKLSGVVLAEQVQNFARSLEKLDVSDTSKRESGWGAI